MFFEPSRSAENNYFDITVQENNKGFPLHIHKSYECYAVRSGETKVKIDGQEYILRAGDAVLVFPYQSHSYETKENTSTWFCIFSPDLVGSFHNARRVPKNNKFRLTVELPATCDGLLFRKALCYNLCALFDCNAEYIDSSQADGSLISKILFFISENYRKECTLRDVADFVGYDYSYVSKFFKKSTGMPLGAYVNGLRISEGCKMLSHTDMAVREIAESCGFPSQRSFNRDFMKSVGQTPTEYRKNRNILSNER